MAVVDAGWLRAARRRHRGPHPGGLTSVTGGVAALLLPEVGGDVDVVLPPRPPRRGGVRRAVAGCGCVHGVELSVLLHGLLVVATPELAQREHEERDEREVTEDPQDAARGLLVGLGVEATGTVQGEVVVTGEQGGRGQQADRDDDVDGDLGEGEGDGDVLRVELRHRITLQPRPEVVPTGHEQRQLGELVDCVVAQPGLVPGSGVEPDEDPEQHPHADERVGHGSRGRRVQDTAAPGAVPGCRRVAGQRPRQGVREQLRGDHQQRDHLHRPRAGQQRLVGAHGTQSHHQVAAEPGEPPRRAARRPGSPGAPERPHPPQVPGTGGEDQQHRHRVPARRHERARQADRARVPPITQAPGLARPARRSLACRPVAPLPLARVHQALGFYYRQ